MDVNRIIFGGMRSQPITSTLSMLISALLYVIYSNVPYSSTNVPSKSLLRDYDFIVVGGGSAGMVFHIIHAKFRPKSDKRVSKISVSVYLRAKQIALLLLIGGIDAKTFFFKLPSTTLSIH